MYDWRAPIASMYYDFDAGRASYETPNGICEGEISKKRQYKITDGKIEYMFDTKTTIRDELLGRVLAENTDKKLKVIISSIQKEQNAAIRSLNSRVLIISGPAGSGKTSVGLHRMAYLLYHDRKKLTSDQIVILSNNNIFNSYISNILPELGEEDATRNVFETLMKQYLPEGYVTYDYYEQVEFLLHANRDEVRAQGIRCKNTERFLDYMKEYFTTYQFEAADLMYRDKVVCEKEKVRKYFSKELGRDNYKVSIERLEDLIQMEYEEYFKRNKEEIKKTIREESEEYLFDSELENCLVKECYRSISEAKKKVLGENAKDEVALYERILHSYCMDGETDGTTDHTTGDKRESKNAVYEETKRNIENKILYYEDCLALLCIGTFTGRIQPFQMIRHVLIDEAQDYSLLALYFIHYLYKGSSFTIMADVNQAVVSGTTIHDISQFQSIFPEKTTVHALTKSYRSSGPINRLAYKLLGDKQDVSYMEREGEIPKLIETKDFIGTIEGIVHREKETKHSIGILVYEKRQAEELYEGLKQKLDLELIISAEDELRENIVIMPVIYAKGLEFDTVIVAGDFKKDFYGVIEKNLLYLMCTRALHRLYLLSSEEFPGSLSECKDLLQ